MEYLAQKEHFWVCPITEHIVRIIGAGQENMTLIEGEDKALLFDTGSGYGNIRKLCEQITRKPIVVVASHGHLDHVGGVGYFEEVYVHGKDLEMASAIYSAEARAACEDMLSEQTRNAHLSINLNDMAPDSSKVIWNTVKEGDLFELGGICLEVIEMPGHTQGSIILVNREEGYALTGDSVTRETLLNLDGAPEVSEYRDHLKKFVRRFKGVIHVAMPGHGGAIPDPFTVFEGNLDAVEGILSGKYGGYPDPRHTRLGKNVYRAKPEIEKESFSVGLEGFCRDGMLGNVLFSCDRAIK